MLKNKADCVEQLEKVIEYIWENRDKFNHWKGCLNMARQARNIIEEDVKRERD